jgi:MFS family permease
VKLNSKEILKMLSKILGTSFNQAAALLFIGLAIGIITAWIGILSGNTLNSILKTARLSFFSLFLIMPAALLFFTWSYVEVKPDVYSSLAYSIILAVLAGAGGALFGSLAFIAGLTLVPGVWGDHDPVVLNSALVKTIGWNLILIVTIITAMVGGYLGYWANSRVGNV